MSAKTEQFIKNFTSAVERAGKKKTSPYDARAVVTRVDGDEAWVSISGSPFEETPVSLTMNAKPGDRVIVRSTGGSAFLIGNASNPPTDDTRANIAVGSANKANSTANAAMKAAELATEAANSAVADAERAAEAANSAVASAGRAETAAQTADSKAEAATQSANEAKASATIANETANGAVTSLGIVQNVVDALETDMDDMQTHVAMMDAVIDPQTGETIVPAGLHVVPTANGYFIVISNDGMYVYDPQSVLVATFGENINFNSYRPQRIGGEDAYVEYYDSDNDGQADSLRIVGANITVSGGKDVIQLIDESSRLIYDHDYTYSGTDVSFVAHLYKGIEEVTSNYPPECFTWYLKSESGIEYLNSGYTITLSEALFDYRATVVGRFENEVEYALIDSEDYRILDSNGNQIITHAIY